MREDIVELGFYYPFSIIHSPLMTVPIKESKQGRMADALALGGDEGRDKLR